MKYKMIRHARQLDLCVIVNIYFDIIRRYLKEV